MSRIFQEVTVAGHRREINVRPRAERGCDTSIECEHLDELRGVAAKAESTKTEYERALERVIAAAVELPLETMPAADVAPLVAKVKRLR